MKQTSSNKQFIQDSFADLEKKAQANDEPVGNSSVQDTTFPSRSAEDLFQTAKKSYEDGIKFYRQGNYAGAQKAFLYSAVNMPENTDRYDVEMHYNALRLTLECRHINGMHSNILYFENQVKRVYQHYSMFKAASTQSQVQRNDASGPNELADNSMVIDTYEDDEDYGNSNVSFQV